MQVLGKIIFYGIFIKMWIAKRTFLYIYEMLHVIV